jgi:hypothetical protein
VGVTSVQHMVASNEDSAVYAELLQSSEAVLHLLSRSLEPTVRTANPTSC